MRSRSGAVHLLLFQTKHVTRKIDTMDSSSESEFKEEEMLLLYALYRHFAFLATSFFAFSFAIASLGSVAFTFHKQVYSLSLIVSTSFSSLSIWFSIPRSTTVNWLLTSHVAVSFQLNVGLRRNRTQVYSQVLATLAPIGAQWSNISLFTIRRSFRSVRYAGVCVVLWTRLKCTCLYDNN